MVKLNNSDEYESLGVIKLTKEKFPKAFDCFWGKYLSFYNNWHKIGTKTMDRL